MNSGACDNISSIYIMLAETVAEGLQVLYMQHLDNVACRGLATLKNFKKKKPLLIINKYHFLFLLVVLGINVTIAKKE